MAVRAKFKYSEHREFKWHPDYEASHTLVFTADYDPNIPEDQRFSKATPCGRFEMTVDNPAAREQFELGKSYYFDITPADPA